MTYTLILLLFLPGSGDIPHIAGVYDTQLECEQQAAKSYNMEFIKGMYVRATTCLTDIRELLAK